MNSEWEPVGKGDWRRQRVFGGWAYHHSTRYIGRDGVEVCSECGFFIPDEKGEWVITPS